MLLPPDSIAAAYERLRDVVLRTPLRRSEGLSEHVGGDVFLKLECEQRTGSFKVRGAFNALATATERERSRGVVASSAGNHGMGVAFAARHFGVPATIFVPSSAPRVKKEGIAKLGASVDDSEPDYDAAMVRAKCEAAARGMLFVNPCIGDAVLAGQGTVALEILEEMPSLRALVVPVGGGGLLGGSASYVRARAPDVRILGAQSVETAAMSRSLAAGRVVDIPVRFTLADGLAGQIDEEALAIGRASLDEIVTVEESAIAGAIRWLHAHEGIRVEGSGAVAVAALLEGRFTTLPTPAVLVVSGGNIDPERHAGLVDASA